MQNADVTRPMNMRVPFSTPQRASATATDRRLSPFFRSVIDRHHGVLEVSDEQDEQRDPAKQPRGGG